MQNVINTIKYRVMAALFVFVAIAISVVPTAVKADEGSPFDYYPSDNYTSSYDYYPSDNYTTGSSYDYYPSDNYTSSYDYYPSDNYTTGSSYDYYPSDNYSYSSGYDYYPSDNYSGYSYAPYSDTYYSGSSYYQPYSTGGSYGSSYAPSYGSSGYNYPMSWGGGSGNYGGGYSNGSLGFSYSSVKNNYSYSNTDNTCVGQNNCNTVNNQVADNSTNLTGYCEAGGSYNEGDTVVWRATASGGNGNYTYSWSGDVSGSGSSVSKSYNSTGTKYATVRITSGNQSITRDCNVDIRNHNNHNNNLSAICRVSDTRIDEGDRVTYTVDAEGGNSPYDYDWRGDVSGSDDSITKRYNNSGTYTVSVRVQDDDGDTYYANCPTVYVGNDNNNSNITLVSNGTNTPTGTLASGVYLSQIPYTGVKENLKMILFVLGMTLWSAFMAWVFLKRKAQKAGLTQKEMIAKFKRDNLAKKGITA